MSEPPKQSQRDILLFACGVLALGIALFALAGHHRAPPPRATAPKDGHAAIHAPIGPHVPNSGKPGVRLTGFVVDGAGLPVAGAEVSAEPERGGNDRALAGKSSAGSGAGSGTRAGSGAGSRSSSGAGSGPAATAADLS